jgi:hypothetical protein
MRVQEVLRFRSCTLPLYHPYPSGRLPLYRLYELWSVLLAYRVAKGHVSASLDVPTHSLEYELPRTHLLGTSVNRHKRKGP